jgi:hypothetical protein
MREATWFSDKSTRTVPQSRLDELGRVYSAWSALIAAEKVVGRWRGSAVGMTVERAPAATSGPGHEPVAPRRSPPYLSHQVRLSRWVLVGIR